MKFRYLFKPIQIGKLKLKNRIVMPTINHSCSPDGYVNERLIAFYAARAKGGAALLTVGGCAVHELGRSFDVMRIDDDKFIEGFRKMAVAVHEYDCKIAGQLYHAGAYAKSKHIGQQAVAPSAVISKYTRELPREMTKEDINIAVNSFADGAARLKAASFDAVEIVGSAGYLVSEFLSPYTNKRTDEYGGSWENRCRFILEIVAAIKQKVGSDFPVIVRIGGNDFVKGGNTNKDAAILAAELEKSGVDCINVTGGWHESVIPQTTGALPPGGYSYLAKNIKDNVGIPVIVSNRINDPCHAEELLAMGLTDLVNIGRGLMADPDLPNKVQAGQVTLVRKCIACGQGCFDRRFSELPVECMVNSFVGHEHELKKEMAKSPKKILVVGGGPAGMEFAALAKERGHDVTLWEKSNRLGGQVHYAAKCPGKQDFDALIEYQTNMLGHLGVDVKLDTEATVEKILVEAPDAVIIASGSTPIPAPFKIESDGQNIVQANEVLEQNYIPGKNVVVVGGGAVGCETAIYLAERGTITAEQTKFLMIHNAETDEGIHRLLNSSARKITIVEMMKGIGNDIGRSTRWGTKSEIKRLGINSMDESKVVAVTESSVRIQTADQQIIDLPADTVVLAIGSRPLDNLSQELTGKIKEIYKIGDAVSVGRITNAIWQATEIGLAI